MTVVLAHKDVMRLATSPGAKVLAVENFLSDVDRTMPVFFHLQNLEDDARDHKWNAATVTAIRAGLKMIYGEEF